LQSAYFVREENFQTLINYYDQRSTLKWPVIFSLPFWLQTWWEHFGTEFKPLIFSVWKDSYLIGLAPLMHKDSTAYLLGSADVCDYLDFVYEPGEDQKLFSTLLPVLAERGIDRLELVAQRPEAVVFSGFFANRMIKGWRGCFEQENESAEMILPDDWAAYLATLNKKQRHEVRRKIRKLENETNSFCFVQLENNDEIAAFLPHFFSLFLQNQEKEQFLNSDIKGFFYSLITAAANVGLARFGVLEVDGLAVAAVLYFDYMDRIYLYNSGYDHDYAALSVGLLSKIFSIRKSIDSGKQVFDFLKGPEIYKSRLGGNMVPIYKAVILKT
jgi:hypothetical protein